MGRPLTISTRAPTADDLAVGRGVPSGRDGQWRVFEVALDDRCLIVFYPGSLHIVTNPESWGELPAFGLQVIVCNGIWKGADEYVMGGVSKFGEYLEDDAYAAIEAAARAVLNG